MKACNVGLSLQRKLTFKMLRPAGGIGRAGGRGLGEGEGGWYVNEILTEKNCQKRRFVEEPFQHSTVNGLDFVSQFSVLIVNEPLQHRVLIL